MKKLALLFSVLTVGLIFFAYQIKSAHFNFPYPNIVEYVLGLVIGLTTIILVLWKKRRKQKLLLGFTSLTTFVVTITWLNYINEWHPLSLSLPLTSSQSFKVSHQPYPWKTITPKELGYSPQMFNDYFSSLSKWQRLRSMLVVQDGKLMIEKYFKGVDQYNAFNVHSMTKSITATLAGIAIDKGIIASDSAKVMPYFPEYLQKSPHLKALEVKDLLSMRGGFAGWDNYQSVKAALVTEGLNRKPNTQFKYYTGGYQVLSGVLTKASKQSTKAFAKSHLFAPLGIQNAFWRNQQGYYCGGGESYYTPRDLARLGQLYLNQGRVGEKQIVSAQWIKKMFTNYTPSSKRFRKLGDYTEVGYGYGWWLLNYQGHMLYTARGKGGQYLILIPEKNIAIVIIQEWNLKKRFKLENGLLCDLLSIFLNENGVALVE